VSPHAPFIRQGGSLGERREMETDKAWPDPRPTLLWIDDFRPGLAMYKTMFENLGFEVLTAPSGKAGIRLAATHNIDLVVTDYEMPDLDGVSVAAAVKELNPGTPVILFSGSIVVPLRARRVVDACCDKAGSRDPLLRKIYNLLAKKRARALQPPHVAQASDHRQRAVV
jgi:CheY-like chemotaxis protein